MSFIQPCFIRKSPKYLTERVYRLGGRSGDGFWSSNIRTLLVVEQDRFFCLDDEWSNAERLIEKGYIDCCTNEDLFIALSALRDDNDFNQWFISENSEWWKNGHHDQPLNKSSLLGWRKATTKELIEHFK